jgi:hypothetical protein
MSIVNARTPSFRNATEKMGLEKVRLIAHN